MIAVVVPNWNGADFIVPCLRSLQQQTYPDYTIVVVDNGSVDESKDIIRDQFSDVILIELDRNHGFAGGVNQGIRYALDNHFWGIALFNNDAEADKNWLKELVLAAKSDQKIAAVTSQFLSINGKTIDSIGDYYSIWGLPFPKGRGMPRQDSTKLEEVFGASGGASLYRADLFRTIGLFDEDFFAYYEDIDVSFRARLAGWKILYQPKAIAYHHIGGTSSKMSGFARYHSIKNMFFVYTKDMPARLFWRYLPRFWIAVSLVAYNSLRQKQSTAMLRGWLWALIFFPKMLIKRWGIQSRRRASAMEIDQWLYHALPPTQIKTLQAFSKFPIVSKWLLKEPANGQGLD